MILQKKQTEMVEKIKNRVIEVQKELDHDISNRLKLVDAELEKRADRSARISALVADLATKMKSSPATEQQVQQELKSLETLLFTHSKYFKEELAASTTYLTQELPSSFGALAEPILGLELLDASRKAATGGAEGGRNAGLRAGPSQMTEVRYKDTFSTCDNRTNLELTTQAAANEQELLNGTVPGKNMGSAQRDECLAVLWGTEEGNV